MFSGYWHIKLREQDRKYTAFSTDSHGLCQWTRLPFGLATSGSQFVRSIEKVLREDHPESVPESVDPTTGKAHTVKPILHSTVEMFVDDGTIHTNKGQDHIDEVARCLKQLMWHDITLKISKCMWCTDEATLIGHTVKCGHGIMADPGKVADLLAIKQLATIGDLKAFLGSCVFLSRFLKDYALLTGPLYALEAKYKTKTTAIRHEGAGKNWYDKHETAFKALKAALASAPCLAFPDWSRPMIVAPDCSKLQMGGVLMQLDKDGNERILAFTSKRLTKAQQRYGVTSKEGQALTHCLRKWRCYVHGHPTVIITDHKALTSLTTRSDFDTDRLNRISAEIMEYDLHIVHRPGRLLHTSDLMSRGIPEEDPVKREAMIRELLAWRAQQEIQAERDHEDNEKALRRIKEDDQVGETPIGCDAPPHLQSPAERFLAGDASAYEDEKLQQHISRLVQGAQVDMDDVDSCESVARKVQHITEAMDQGTYESDSDYVSDEEDEDPRIIDMYEMACASIGWQNPTTHRLPSEKEMRVAQQADPYTSSMVKALEDYESGAWQSETDEEWSRRNAANYVVQDNTLKKAWIKGQGRRAETVWQTVVPTALQVQVLRAYHTSARNSHYGALRTFAQMREKFIWGRMFGDTHKFVSECEVCQRFGARPSKEQRKHHLRCDTPGEHWVVDVVHTVRAKSGHEWILTMIDVCSRWAIARPMKKEEFKNEEIARIISEELSKTGVHIVPKRITHDGGSEFKKRFEDTCHVLQRLRHISIGDRPEGYGIIERFNRDIMQLTAKMCPSGKADQAWAYIIAAACEAHNASIHSNAAQGSVGITPSEVMHGAKPKLAEPLSESHIAESQDNAEPGSRAHVEAVAQAHNKALEHIKACREAYEQRLRDDVRNMTNKTKSFQVGDIVRRGLSDSQMQSIGKKKMKLTAANSEEMIVITSKGFGRYELQKLGDGLAPLIETSSDLMRKMPCPTLAKQQRKPDSTTQSSR